jgi:predicted RNA binding protein YcfA (HicA-like mRNA interferase family)
MSRLPMVTAREAVRALKSSGFVDHHQRGSHLYLWNPEKKLMVSIPMHAGDLDRGLLKLILKQAQLTEEEFRALL